MSEGAGGSLFYRTEFYLGKDINSLSKFSQGPLTMKDIRLVELPSSQIGVFTRPQGEIGGRGQVGFTIIDKLDQLTEQELIQAPLIKSNFTEQEWGGTNQILLLQDGRVGVIGHIASMYPKNDRHYYPISFIFDPKTLEATEFEILATRKEFPKSPAKRPDLIDVLFTGGIERLDKQKANLYVGVSDVTAGVIQINDPFGSL